MRSILKSLMRTTTMASTPDPPTDDTPHTTTKTTLEYAPDIQSTLSKINRPTRTNAKNVTLPVETLATLDSAISLLIATCKQNEVVAGLEKLTALVQDVYKRISQPATPVQTHPSLRR